MNSCDSRQNSRRLALVIGAVLAGHAGTASALQWRFENGARVTWNTSITAGSSWRAEKPDNELYSLANGSLIGLTDGLGGTTDSGTLNYDKGDRFATPFKILTDVEFSKGDFGGLIRAKAWYDHALERSTVRFGHQANAFNGMRYGLLEGGYGPPVGTPFPAGTPWPREQLSDKGFPDEQEFSNVYLLDAYVYGNFSLGNSDLQLRLGNQVVNWGESVFIQGVNQVNPIDVPATRRPGQEVKEVLLPVWMAYANWGFSFGSVEAFYQLEWNNTSVEGCGVYWSQAEGQAGEDPGRCLATANLGGSSPVAQSTGLYFTTFDTIEPKDSGQYGLALRFPVEKLDTEFGLYAMNIHARTPIISARAGTRPAQSIPGVYNATTGRWAGTNTISPAAVNVYRASLAGVTVVPAGAVWEYGEDRHIFGISAATTLLGWSVAGEFSYQPDVAAQLNGADLLDGMNAGRGPLATETLAVVQQGETGYFKGSDEFDKTQFQLNGVKSFSNILGASNLQLTGEVGFQWNGVPDYEVAGNRRYGRAFVYGRGPSAQLAQQVGNPVLAESLCDATAGALRNTQPDGCRLDGYVTDFAWGYRLRARLDYDQVFGTGVRVSPSLVWNHDVDGVAIDGQFNEGRQVLGLGVGFNYARRYSLDLNYNWFADSAFNPLMDRDYYSVSVGVTF